MTTRNRTITFMTYRNETKQDTPTMPHKSSSKSLNDRLLTPDRMEEGTITQLKPPPGWTTNFDLIKYDIREIQKKMTALDNAHKQHLLPTMEDNIGDEQTVEILTGEITKMLRSAGTKLQQLSEQKKAFKAGEERVMMENLVSSTALELQDISNEFKRKQRDYLQRLKGREQKGKTFFHIEEGATDDAPISITFTKSQMSTVLNAERDVNQRHNEIEQIAKSINEISQIFQSFSSLVVEQGTILNRIDYNVEQTLNNVKAAEEPLRKAKESTACGRKLLCITLLCVGILDMFIVIIFKVKLGNK
eukprot:TRINITY_DN22474_c0_g1_i1.p1 TRINITY_DN22474_c0_g1~~TRINITY_DN22474_c0_g1_i1.p1  ORF type:complete len:304 (-),score=80.77 TRINITY_DN22474_c0_g1_i1:33-944(-)